MSNASSQPSLCSEPLLFSFNDLGSRQVIADFSAGYLSSDGGMLLLRQIDEGLGISRSLARCFYDARNPLFIEHSVRELVAQRLLGMAAGYEDLNDHNLLRLDPLFAVAVGKEDPLGSGRAPQDQGKALASASTLNRLELGNNKNSRCHKISADHEAIEDDLLRMGVRCLPKHSLEVVIDLDTTDDPLHGHQEGRFFHGFYGCYCYLPLFAFVGSVPLWAQLHTSDGDAARGGVDALKKIVAAVRKRCRKARIIVRADSGFCREEIMAWCETQQPVVYYCLGLARNSRLRELIDEKFARVRESAILCGGVARGFTEFQYQTLKSWTRSRRVIAKAEVLQDKDNPRFIVTNLPAEGFEDQPQSADRFCAQKCYEDFYCARGDTENQIKQQYLDLEADRTSSHWMASNQLRLWFSAFALLLFQRLRTLALQGTELANATAGTIRQRLLKIGALVRVSTRRVYVRLASAFPLQKLFAQVHRALAGLVAEDG
jgi:Transposase DDE domain group 1